MNQFSIEGLLGNVSKPKRKTPAYKPRRAKASYTSRYAHAELSTSDRKLYAMMKLFENGDFLIEFTRNDGKVFRRELSAKLDYQD